MSKAEFEHKGWHIKVDPNDAFSLNPRACIDACGLTPLWITSAYQGKETLQEFINEVYSHGGGWQPFGKDEWTMTDTGTLVYGGSDDPPLDPYMELRGYNHVVRVYPYAWVSIDGDYMVDGFEVAKMD